MGLKDGRGEIDPIYTKLSGQIADQLYPSMATIPGGESQRKAREEKTIQTRERGAWILKLLDDLEAIDLDDLQNKLDQKNS